MSLADSLERAAIDLPGDADAIRPANGDPALLLEQLEPGAAARVLGWLLANALEDTDELCQVWVETDAGIAALGAVSEDELPKPGRKLLRRAIHRARSRGVEVGAGEVVPRVARLPKADSSISGGFVSSYDPRGARLVYIVEELAAGGARVFEALLDEARGLVDFQVYRAARGQVRSFVRDITRRPRFGAVEAEAESIRALIARRVAGQVADQRLPKAFAEWRGKFTRVVEGTETPGGLVREALEQGASAEALRELAEMVERRELGPWPPNREPLEKAIAGLREQLAGEAESGAAAADSELLEERVRSVLTELYTGESADANAERFEESAYLMWRGQQEEMARACLATADALRTGDAADQPVVAALIAVFAPALTKDMRTSLGSGPSRDEVSVAEPEQESEPKQE